MKLTQFILEELEAETERTRRALERLPEGKHDWKPHERSMIFGHLADMVATMPSWVTMMVNQPELDINPAGPRPAREPLKTNSDHIAALDKAMAGAREALQSTSDEHLMTNWRLLAGGTVVMEQPRYIVIRDTINHWAHHRGQMTVYLRLMGAQVPALYGPSADDQRF